MVRQRQGVEPRAKERREAVARAQTVRKGARVARAQRGLTPVRAGGAPSWDTSPVPVQHDNQPGVLAQPSLGKAVNPECHSPRFLLELSSEVSGPEKQFQSHLPPPSSTFLVDSWEAILE